MPACLPLVRARDRRKIKTIFGTEIYEILSKVKSLRRGKSNCFFVSNPKILENCQISIIEEKRENKYKRYRPIRPLCKKYITMNTTKRQRRENQRMRQKSRANNAKRVSSELSGESSEPLDSEDLDTTDPYLDLIPKKIFKGNTAAIRRTTYRQGVRFGLSTKSPHFPSDHPLESLDPKSLFNNIMGNCSSAQPCFVLLKPHLTKFIMNHKSFKYFYMIQNFTENSKGQYPSQLSENQLNRLFSIIVFKVPPQGLFGHRGNLKYLRSGLLAHIKSRKRRFFIPDAITNKFNLKTINWLKPICDDKAKKLIINKLIEWFIKSYGMTIVTTFLASNRTPDSAERIFFPIMELRKQTDDFINDLLNRKVLEKTFYDKSNEIPVATMNLYLKPNGLRPIYEAFIPANQKKMLDTLLILLKQLNSNKYRSISPNDLHNVWKPFASRIKQSRIFYVTCDVIDAFGSINQEKLSSILDDLFGKLPDNIPYKTFYCMTMRKHRYSTEKNFIHDSLSLTVPRRSLFCEKWRGDGSVPKKLLRDKLQEFINDQLVIINEKCYKMRQGVGQGLSLSTLLSEIYYGRLMQEKFSMFQKLGTLVRYVDDYLYLTNHRVAAELFLFITRNGIADYNCQFNKSKTHTNLPPISENKFVFLGYKFNTITGEVMPVVSEAPSQHNMTLRPVKAKEEKPNFRKRMMAFGGLKLMKLILDPQINSKLTIVKAFSLISCYTAQKCLILCLHLINPETFSEEFVFRVIHGTIDKMMRIYYAKVSKNKGENQAIRLSIWQVYVSVLRMNSMTRKKVVPLLQEKIHILKKKFEECTKTS